MADDTLTVEQAKRMPQTTAIIASLTTNPQKRTGSGWCEELKAAVIADRDALIAAVRAEDATCATCQHWLPWHRADAAKPHVSTKGDCTHPLLRGHLNGIDQTFGCRFHGLR